MSKRAEEAAMKAYPDILREAYSQGNGNEIILNWTEDRSDERRCFQEGYEQAEKDYIELAQLWLDSGYVNIMSFKQFLKCHETQSNK